MLNVLNFESQSALAMEGIDACIEFRFCSCVYVMLSVMCMCYVCAIYRVLHVPK